MGKQAPIERTHVQSTGLREQLRVQCDMMSDNHPEAEFLCNQRTISGLISSSEASDATNA